jgi:hypothetical protein
MVKSQVEIKTRGVASLHFITTDFNPLHKRTLKTEKRAVGSVHIYCEHLSSPAGRLSSK